jgi:K+/H+ antiporter YhaU regulatory subunit KhtT
MSYVSLGANAIFNFLNKQDTLMLAEGLNIFRVKVPSSLEEKSLADSKIRKATNCSVVAVSTDGRLSVNPDPHAPIPANAELIMIGTHAGERKFFELFES